MLYETFTDEYVIYRVELRKPKMDDYAKRKRIKDQIKLQRWLTALLQHHEVIIFYDDEGEEKCVVGTLLRGEAEFPDAPLEVFFIKDRSTIKFNYCNFYAMPKLEPMTIHLDKIKKFIVKNENITEISKTVSMIV